MVMVTRKSIGVRARRWLKELHGINADPNRGIGDPQALTLLVERRIDLQERAGHLPVIL